MQKNRHRVLRSGTTFMAMATLVLCLAAVRPAQAQVSLDEVITGTAAVLKKPKPGPKPGPKSVPEPDTNVLLLLGLGMTGLVGYGVHRRKHLA